jgi:lysophospholipase L1-like esterase
LNLKDIKFYLVGSLLIISTVFGAVEITTRVVSWLTGNGFTLALHEYEPYDQEITKVYQWHPFTGITFKPGVTITGSHPAQKALATVYIDRHGFLSDRKTLRYQKSVDEVRIAFIGASTTASLYLSFDQNWPGHLENLISDAMPGKKISIINAAVPGFDTAQSIGNLALRVMPFEPDIVIIYHLYNDLKAVCKNVSFRPDYSHIHPKPFGLHQRPNVLIRSLNNSMAYVRLRNRLRGIKEKQLEAEKRKKILSQTGRLTEIPQQAVITFEQHIRSLVSIASAGGATVILSSFASLHNPQLDYTQTEKIRRLSRFKKEEIFRVINFIPGLTLEAVFEGLQRYNRVLEKIAMQEKTGWVDNAALIPHQDLYFVDRVHFSKEGAALMARNLFPVVMQELKKL